MDNFWDNSHPLSAANERLYNELVPGSGHCETLQGELLRAATKISYDWYNNGWGCNNWSGAVVFLKGHAVSFAQQRTDDEKKAFRRALSFVHEYSHGESTKRLSDDRAEEHCTTIVAFVVQSILDNPTPVINQADMWEFGEPPAPWEEDEDDEDGY